MSKQSDYFFDQAERYDKVAALLEVEGQWCQGNEAVSAKGNDVSPMGRAAISWGFIGACDKYGAEPFYARGVLKISNPDEVHWSTAQWNDSPDRKQEQVVKLARDIARDLRRKAVNA